MKKAVDKLTASFGSVRREICVKRKRGGGGGGGGHFEGNQ